MPFKLSSQLKKFGANTNSLPEKANNKNNMKITSFPTRKKRTAPMSFGGQTASAAERVRSKMGGTARPPKPPISKFAKRISKASRMLILKRKLDEYRRTQDGTKIFR